MQKNNPDGFFSFLSKVLFLGVLGEVVFYMLGIVFVLPVLLIGLAISYIWIRIADREIWRLSKEQFKLVDEVDSIKKSIRAGTYRRDKYAIQSLAWVEVDELEIQIKELSDRIILLRAKHWKNKTNS